ncbi:MAG TPA: hypothetical protein PK308_00090 [Phycisphaerales bacterium]|nr:hypothetical protein [Phycisphaerales bacterium]
MAKGDRYRFATSWADKDFSYDEGQVVTLEGKKYTADAFPLEHGKKLVKSGILKPVAAGDKVRETAALG